MRELRDLYDEFGNKTELTYYKGDEIPKGDYGVTGGHPKSGETPYEGIITEVKEELGIDISKYDITEFDSGCDGKDCYKMYYVKADLDIADLNIQKEELTLVKYFSMQELEEMVEN